MSKSGDATPEQTKRAKIREYFALYVDPKYLRRAQLWALGCLIALLMFFGIAVAGHPTIGFILGAIILILCGRFALVNYLAFARNKDRATDREMDAWLRHDIARLRSRALDRSGFDRESLLNADDPMVIVIPPDWEDATQARCRGQDDVIRWNPVKLVVVFNTANQFLAYQGEVDLFTGDILAELTDEIFFSHVAAVQVESNVGKLPSNDPNELARIWTRFGDTSRQAMADRLDALRSLGRMKLGNSEAVVIKTTGNHVLRVAFSDGRSLQPEEAAFDPCRGNDLAIGKLRRLLREKALTLPDRPPMPS